jgi:hypothetical protein
LKTESTKEQLSNSSGNVFGLFEIVGLVDFT